MKKLPLILSLAFVSSHAQTMDADAPPAPPQIPVTFSTPPAPAAGQPQGGRSPLGGQRVTDAKRLARTWGQSYSANTCFTRSVSSRSMMPKSRSMLGCLPGWARAWSVCSAKSSSPLRAASGVSAP